MKKILPLFLSAVLLFSLAACNREKAEIALIISEKGTFAVNTFHQSAWRGIAQYGDNHNIAYTYYEPEENYDDEYKIIVEKAVKNGAKILVFPGYLLESTVFFLQDQYPDVEFILIDGVPNNGAANADYEEHVASNTYSILYAEEQAGFLAGYAAVKDGFRQLGFFGGKAVPAVIRFGYGYIQGAEYAAQELGLGKASVTLKYLYTGSFTPGPEYQSKAAEWYWAGTEVIFACGGGIGQSVIKAAEGSGEGKWVIGVDTDQSVDSDRVLTSAMKMIDNSLYGAITDYYNGIFPGGQAIFLGADKNGIGLPVATSRFRSFSTQEYDTIFTALATDQNGVASGIVRDSSLPLSAIKAFCVTVIEERMR